MWEHVTPSPLDEVWMVKDALHATATIVRVVCHELKRVVNLWKDDCDKVVYPIHFREKGTTFFDEVKVGLYIPNDDEFFHVFQTGWMILHVPPFINTHIACFHDIFTRLHDYSNKEYPPYINKTTTMLTLMMSQMTVTCGEPKKLRKFRKRLARERREDLNRMAEKIKDIAEDEKRRSKELLREHREFFETPRQKKDKSIDFYEK